jgi:RecA-family ATPase
MTPSQIYGYIETNTAQPRAQPQARKRANGNGATPPGAAHLPSGETVSELLKRDIPAPIMLCNPWAPEGINIIAGRPKLGKSTLLRQKMAAVAEGDPFWGEVCERSATLYLSLEEGERLTKAKFLRARFTHAATDNIRVRYEWPRGAQGVIQLQDYLLQNPEVRYVGIDSLSRFRDVPDRSMSAMVSDYEALNLLHEALKTLPGVCIDVLHHTRKMTSEDPVDLISGTFGITAAIDSYWVMQHYQGGAKLHVGGRLWDRDESDYVLSKGEQRWTLTGEGVPLPPAQAKALEIVRRDSGTTPSKLGDELGISRASAMERLQALADKGFVRNMHGMYIANELGT